MVERLNRSNARLTEHCDLPLNGEILRGIALGGNPG